ncbi:MAG: Eco57I restriction-modification methylase domain-containing protein [Bacteroidetes bacterium]|nr:Eco57I restriction-modification methylase domain-containing protein [Bacteroidota bacterium]
MISKETAFEQIKSLVIRFEEQFSSYKSDNYNETLTRRDFIDPFFRALGWDMDNSQGYAEAYREVIHEDKVNVCGATKAPDYSFKLPGGKRLFFVEAKKPQIDIKNDILPAYQIRRYGWSAKLPISIITDFEEFSIYDCTRKPSPNDNPAVCRIRYLTWKEYLAEFDFIWDTFSKEKVLKGSFDKFVQSDTAKKGTATVDKEFLLSLDDWRKTLAAGISKANNNILEEELNFAVQCILDRLIFLRIAEDRNIEPYGNLSLATGQGEAYANLLALFNRADEKYNSGLFDFKKDTITPFLQLDAKVVKGIINELYYPSCPYEFSVLPVEILGSAYEQFLGKQIHITGSHRVKVEEKPEVRKAGGVYYTPQYIVDYIVKNTVGRLIDGKSPVEIATIRIVDPACGSGSFLLGAYRYLLDFYRSWYIDYTLPSRGKKEQPLTPEGNLSTAEKKRILTTHIFGVDIDVNAVEVTKLSLLLKCMEGETQASIKQQFTLWNERVLPSLDDNIKSGNSLIDLDFYDQELDLGQQKKIKPFSWERSFPSVFAGGGFDVVIGNPPYVRQEMLGDQKEYFQQKYKVYHGMADLYSYFIERGIGLLKEKGLFGFIVANKWMRANYGEPLRKWIKTRNIREIIDFGDLQIFKGATTYPCILICGNGDVEKQIRLTVIKTLQFDSLDKYVAGNHTMIDQSSLDDSGWNLGNETEQQLLLKIKNAGIPLGEYVKGKIYYGIKTGLNEAYVIDEATKERLIREDPRSAGVIKPFLAGRDIKRYFPLKSDKYLIFFPKGFTNEQRNNKGYPWRWLQDNYHAIANHLVQYETKAKKRFDQGDYWWELRTCDYYEEFEKPKILLPDIALKMEATYDKNRYFCVNTAYIIPVDDKYLLAVLNSKLVHLFYSKLSSSIRGGYLRFIRQYLEIIPIKQIDQANDSEKSIYNSIISNVDHILQLNKDLQSATLPDQKEQIKARIDYCDDKINKMVYQLYGLTEEEIKVTNLK